MEFKGRRQKTRVLQWHHVTYTYPTVEVDEVEDAVRRELEGPGKLLAYRRTCVCSNIRCRSRCTRWKRLLNLRRRKTKGTYTSRGPNWVHALDGHDKSMRYQNSTLPIADYGCIDTCSRKMLWAKVWVYLYKARTIASKLRLEKGSETGVMALMHLLLRQHHGDMDLVKTVMYGPSTSNQVCALFYVMQCFSCTKVLEF